MNFGRLANELNVDDIKDAFDIKLSEIIRAKHDEKVDSDNKVLGLNRLTQLQQKLRTRMTSRNLPTTWFHKAGLS